MHLAHQDPTLRIWPGLVLALMGGVRFGSTGGGLFLIIWGGLGHFCHGIVEVEREMSSQLSPVLTTVGSTPPPGWTLGAERAFYSAGMRKQIARAGAGSYRRGNGMAWLAAADAFPNRFFDFFFVHDFFDG